MTAFSVPGEAKRIQEEVYDDSVILIATGLGKHKRDIIRIGHMGFNADVEKVDRTMDALEQVV